MSRDKRGNRTQEVVSSILISSTKTLSTRKPIRHGSAFLGVPDMGESLGGGSPLRTVMTGTVS